MDAAIQVRLSSVPSMQNLWDPARNRALGQDRGRVDERELLAGAIAFTLAHEAHHMLAHEDMVASTPEAPELRGRAAVGLLESRRRVQHRGVHRH